MFRWSYADLVAIGGCLVTFWAIKTYLEFRKLRRAVNYAPGPNIFFSAATTITRLLPNIPGINRTSDWSWRLKYSSFGDYGQDIVAPITFYPSPRVSLHVGDADAIKEITSNRTSFPKPVQFYKIINLFGSNILSTEGDEWRMHRKIVAKSFTERNNRLVWEQTISTVLDLFTTWERDGRLGNAEEEGALKVTDIASVMRELALMVISAAAFGMNLSWKDSESVPAGHTMSFKTSLHHVSEGFLHRVALPDWILSLYPFGRKTKAAYNEMELYVREMIEERRIQPADREDLLSNLLKARDEEDIEVKRKEEENTWKFTDSDLLGNIFTLLFAGHETSANTMSFVLAFLALYPNVQQRFLQEIKSVVGNGGIPTYADVPKLVYGAAIIQEALRLIPIVPVIPKISAVETQFTTTAAEGAVKNISVPHGTPLLINVVGLHYNPKLWDDPYEFRPERFLQAYNKHAWIPFSAGSRSCIGRRFAELELLAAVTLFVSHFNISVPSTHGGKGGATVDDQKRMLDPRMSVLLLGARKFDLKFTRRSG
ncbi:cytochrome P450 [Serendipita vermifera]|nr:cytochrome P450 [Serendipita vermifera]